MLTLLHFKQKVCVQGSILGRFNSFSVYTPQNRCNKWKTIDTRTTVQSLPEQLPSNDNEEMTR